MFIGLKRILKSGWSNFRRNTGLSLATMFVMVMVISLGTSLFFLQMASDFLVKNLKDRVDMYVYFNKELTGTEVMQIEEELSRLPEVRTIEYVSKDQALEEFMVLHEGDQAILDSLNELGRNPLLASLNIKAWETEQYASISKFLENSSFSGMIAKMDYYQKKPAIDKLFSMTSNLNRAGIAVGAILTAVAVLLAFNAVRLSIYNSGQEIGIMKMVGASNWFVRGPFLIQGAIVGILAALITFLITGAVFFVLTSSFRFLLLGSDPFSFFVSNFPTILLFQLIAGVGLSVLSSWVAVRRYLKV